MLKRLLIGLFLLCGIWAIQPQAAVNAPDIGCDQQAIYDTNTSGNTELVALTTGNRIYVCGYVIRTGATGINVRLVYGTGTACATGETSLTPIYTLSAYDGLVDTAVFYRGMRTPVSNALCIETDAAVAIDAIVYFSKI